MVKHLVAYIDGACRGNPGEGGVGVAFQDEKGTPFFKAYRYIGTVTNNIAEYRALLLALKKARNLRAKSLTIYSDSQLIVNQVRGDYRVRDAKLKLLLREALSLIKGFQRVEMKAIGREKNKLADSLANRAIDTKGEEEYLLNG
jgi:ribonuclease HI